MSFIRKTVLATVAGLMLATPGMAKDLLAESAGQTGLTTIVLQVVARDLAGTGTQISLNSGQTLSRSALSLATGKIDIAITPPRAYNFMTKGTGPYTKLGDQAIELSGNIRSLFAFTGGALHPIVRADSDIKNWDDVAGNRVYIGPPGGGANQQIMDFVEVMSGLDADADYEPVRMGWGAAVQAFQDGQFDVLNYSTAVGSANIVQLLLQGDYRFIPAPDGITETKAYADYLRVGSVAGGIPAGAYEGIENGDTEITTYNYTMTVGVNADMSDDEAYLLTSTFWENLDANKKEIALLRALTKTPFAGNNIPLHPGAVRYYKEQAMEIPASLMPQ